MNRRHFIFLLALLGLAAIVRFSHIGRYCYTTDEVHSIHMATGWERAYQVAEEPWLGPRGVVPQLATKDIHPPLYFVGLNLWMRIAGTEPLATRAASALVMLACIPLLWLLARRLTDPATAWVATGICALSAYQVRYAQDIRMYALAQFLVLLSTYLFVRLLAGSGSRKTIVVLYGLSVTLTLLTHYFMLYIFVFHGLYLLLDRRSRMAAWKPFVIAQVLALLLFVPWGLYAHSRERFEHGFTKTDWLKHTGNYSYWETAGLHVMKYVLDLPAFVGDMDWPPRLGWPAFGALALVLCLGIVGMVRNRRSARFLALWLLVPILGMVTVDRVSGRNAFYVSRYLIGIAPALYLILACGVTAFRSRTVQVVLSVLVLGVLVAGLYRYHFTVPLHHPYDQVAETIEKRYPQQPMIVASTSLAIATKYYLTNENREVFVPNHAKIKNHLKKHNEVVVIRPPQRGNETDEMYQAVDRLLKPKFVRKEEQSTHCGDVRIEYYVRKAG